MRRVIESRDGPPREADGDGATSRLPYHSLIEPILKRGREDPDWPGLVLMAEDGSREIVTAAGLAAGVVAMAGGLRVAGIGSGSIVVLVLEHSRALIECFLGAMCAGAVPTIFAGHLTDRLDSELYRGRLAALIENADARAVITSTARRGAVHALAPSRRILAVESLADHSLSAEDVESPAPDADAFIQFTSGSGGVQKAVAHTHGTLLRYIEVRHAMRRQPVPERDVVVNWLPLSHDLGLLSGLLAPQVLGMRAVLMSPLHWARSPHAMLRAITEYGGTVCSIPNFALNHCARAVRERDLGGVDLHTLRELVCGGEPVRSESMEVFCRRFGAYGFRADALRAGYGMAEVIEAATLTPAGAPPRVDWIDSHALQRDQRALPVAPDSPAAHAVVSCGAPFHGTELRIVGGDGNLLPERSAGEIAIRSPFLFRGYRGQPSLDEVALRDGWLFSGDLGYLAGGELYVTGRKKDLIIAGGRNLAPEDLERVAESTPGVAPGRTVAFGIADPSLGSERPVVVCEMAQPLDAAAATVVEREVRRRVSEAFDVALGDVRVVSRGWVIKTSSGKNARPDNRSRYLNEFCHGRLAGGARNSHRAKGDDEAGE